MKKIKILFSITIFVIGLSACVPGPPNPGFRVKTTRTTRIGGSPVPSTSDANSISVFGTLTSTYPGLQTTGNIGAFSGVTNANAYYDVNGGKTAAIWQLGEWSGPCADQSISQQILNAGSTITLDCRDITIPFFFFSPSMIQRDSPPESLAVEGSGISTAGGMPTVEYYNMNGVLVAQDTATQVAPDGSGLSVATPNLSLLSNGAYVVAVRNPDGNFAGNGTMVIFDYFQSPGGEEPPPDPGSCGREQVCPEYPPAY
jgi:hypothetical protein